MDQVYSKELLYIWFDWIFFPINIHLSFLFINPLGDKLNFYDLCSKPLWQGVGTTWSSRGLPTHTTLWFYDSQKSRLIKSEAVSQHSRTKMLYTFINGRINSKSRVDTEILVKHSSTCSLTFSSKNVCHLHMAQIGVRLTKIIWKLGMSKLVWIFLPV